MGNRTFMRFGSMPFHLPDNQAAKNMKISRFLFFFAFFIAFLAIPPLIAGYYYPGADIVIPYFWNLFWIFAGLTGIIYLFAYWRMSLSYRSSGQALLGSVTVKLLVCMIIAFVYISKNSVDPAKFILDFFYLYFFHTVFELYCLLCNLRNQKFK